MTDPREQWEQMEVPDGDGGDDGVPGVRDSYGRGFGDTGLGTVAAPALIEQLRGVATRLRDMGTGDWRPVAEAVLRLDALRERAVPDGTTYLCFDRDGWECYVEQVQGGWAWWLERWVETGDGKRAQQWGPQSDDPVATITEAIAAAEDATQTERSET